MGFFVGYGSLVNRRTHDHETVYPTRLRGWRRMWRKTNLREAAFLTVVPDLDCEIDALVAAVDSQDWQVLDQREAAYGKHAARHQIEAPLPDDADVVVYAIEEGRHHPPDSHSPVLLSYIDVVVQGYLHVFGPEGVTRHQQLSDAETALVDDMLSQVGVRPR